MTAQLVRGRKSATCAVVNSKYYQRWKEQGLTGHAHLALSGSPQCKEQHMPVPMHVLTQLGRLAQAHTEFGLHGIYCPPGQFCTKFVGRCRPACLRPMLLLHVLTFLMVLALHDSLGPSGGAIVYDNHRTHVGFKHTFYYKIKAKPRQHAVEHA